jgi:hypothetical protein
LDLCIHRDSAFRRLESKEKEDSEMFITFRITESVAPECLKKFFWYLRENRARIDDKISCEVVSTVLEKCISNGFAVGWLNSCYMYCLPQSKEKRQKEIMTDLRVGEKEINIHARARGSPPFPLT